MIICKKVYFDKLSYCGVILKLNDNEFISSISKLNIEGSPHDLFLLEYDQGTNNIKINDNCKGAHNETIEAILSLNNRVFLISDSSGNLKIWNINKNG